MKVKTSELIGPALDWAVAKCEGVKLHSYRHDGELKLNDAYAPEDATTWSPTTDWSQGGPIIEREKVRLDTTWNCEDGYWSARMDAVGGWWLGDTPLIAAMRCYVVSKLGDEVEIPEELLK